MNKIENRSEIYMGMAKKNYKTVNLDAFKLRFWENQSGAGFF